MRRKITNPKVKKGLSDAVNKILKGEIKLGESVDTPSSQSIPKPLDRKKTRKHRSMLVEEESEELDPIEWLKGSDDTRLDDHWEYEDEEEEDEEEVSPRRTISTSRSIRSRQRKELERDDFELKMRRAFSSSIRDKEDDREDNFGIEDLELEDEESSDFPEKNNPMGMSPIIMVGAATLVGGVTWWLLSRNKTNTQTNS